MDAVKVLFGRHGDIKPANILWFLDDPGGKDGKGVLKIADFSIAEFTTQNAVSRKHVANSRFYHPPETGFSDPVISPSYDMWSLGCVYLEFIAWYFGGWIAVEDFLDKRSSVDDDYHIPYRRVFHVGPE